jgi:hypothetical protein
MESLLEFMDSYILLAPTALTFATLTFLCGFITVLTGGTFPCPALTFATLTFFTGFITVLTGGTFPCPALTFFTRFVAAALTFSRFCNHVSA